MEIVGILAAIIYAGGFWKFWTGFRRTNFSDGKLRLSALWPILLFNKSYRQNFGKALKG
jgi:hypothetical protein